MPLLIPSVDTGLFVRMPAEASVGPGKLGLQFSRLPYLVGDIAAARSTPIVRMGGQILRFVRSSLSHSVDLDASSGTLPGRKNPLVNETEIERASPALMNALRGNVLVFTRRDTQIQAVEGLGEESRLLWNMTIADLEEPQVFTSGGER